MDRALAIAAWLKVQPAAGPNEWRCQGWRAGSYGDVRANGGKALYAFQVAGGGRK